MVDRWLPTLPFMLFGLLFNAWMKFLKLWERSQTQILIFSTLEPTFNMFSMDLIGGISRCRMSISFV